MNSIPLIPYPMSLDIYEEDGYLVLDKDFIIKKNKKTEHLTELLKKEIKDIINLDLEIKKEDDDSPEIIVKVDVNEFFEDFAYYVHISEDQIILCGACEESAFYALQTFKQLLFFYGNKLPFMELEDEESISWRGLHMDVSRHFFKVSFIKKILDMMALIKLNRFHWHLTDDQGWRIESKRFPELNRIGSYRTENGEKYGGYYTQDEIREIVEYAQARNIEVVPEIDLPGHTQAMIASYPELACEPDNYEVWNQWGVSIHVLCMGKERTYSFIQELLEEIIPLFKSEYFHIGGDECPTNVWADCPDCQKKKTELGLKSNRELQFKFNEFLARILEKHGKTLIGWDEINEGKLPEDSICMCWRGDGKDALLRTVKQEKRAIMTPNTKYYFDWKQSIYPDEKGGFGITTLKTVYEYCPSEMFEDDDLLVIGLQANVWTEMIDTEELFEYMLFPRILAIAERGWNYDDPLNYPAFKERVDFFTKNILKHYKVNYCDRYI